LFTNGVIKRRKAAAPATGHFTGSVLNAKTIIVTSQTLSQAINKAQRARNWLWSRSNCIV
jgi:hypothetical protein